jgi:ABC-type oligopeptide transport system substrate-binding subunit
MINRRAFLATSAAGLISCRASRGEYFGTTVLASSRKLVHSLGAEIESLDPAKSTFGWEFYVIPALFEGLTQYHPRLPEPMAALATHYEASPDQTQFTFYLRGHPAPRGTRLASAESLPFEFTRGRKSAADAVPACWSDGVPLTAEDLVYSWKRLLDPNTAAPMSYQFYCVRNAEDIQAGKCSPRDLGVRALDDFTFQIDLRSPTPFFLPLITQYPCSPVPRHAIEAARWRGNESSWTEPEHIAVSGPFLLRNCRRFQAITALKNPRYYDAHLVGVDELVFEPVVDGTTAMNLYRSGAVTATPGFGLPPLFAAMLGSKKDFQKQPTWGTACHTFSTRKPPLDNTLLRYALNLGTEKRSFCDLLGAGQVPAATIVPPMPHYPAASVLNVEVDGHSHDVLSFNIQKARALFTKAGFRSRASAGGMPEITYHTSAQPHTRLIAELVQQQWSRNLGIRVQLAIREFTVHWKMVLDGDYTGIAFFEFLPSYFDPNPFLDPFLTHGPGNPTGWTDPLYTSMLADANRTLVPKARLTKLADCEQRLLTAMPFAPVYFDALAYLQKPFVKGFASNLFDIRSYKYAWIDTKWRPS